MERGNELQTTLENNFYTYSKSANISVPTMCDMYTILYNCLGLFTWKVNKSRDINYTVTLSMPNLQQIIVTSLLEVQYHLLMPKVFTYPVKQQLSLYTFISFLDIHGKHVQTVHNILTQNYEKQKINY